MPQPETLIVRKILKELQHTPGCYAFKSHGNRYQAGQPDILGCLRGRSFALEVKVPGKDATPLQKSVLSWWSAAGALTGVVHSLEEAKEALGL